MGEFFRDHPGRLFVAATLLPLAAAVSLLLIALVRSLIRRSDAEPGSIPRAGAYAILFAMALAAVLSVGGTVLLLQEPHDHNHHHAHTAWQESFEWIRYGSSVAEKPGTIVRMGYFIDDLTAIAMSMVTVVGSLIVLFSIGYMQDETKPVTEDHALHLKRRGRFGRFFAFLGLFAFSMMNLLIADNLFQVFMSWELVGVCSFFLIGFYTERPTASSAANKAFIVNRIGDAGFLIALFIAWTQLGTFDIATLNERLSAPMHGGLSDSLWILFGAGLFLGCVGKSAQVPLQTWLPDAMEGPTPVSALIHAATMVAAGVYLVGRCFPMFAPDVLTGIAFIGAITLFISATTACVQTDIKRVLAFSTCSQLGFMMLALGLGGWVAGLFHLLTHAFFKALLFLGAGSVIHACHHEQDLLKMGGLRSRLPVTSFTMLIGVLAICGMPFFSGWYSKDQIVAQVFGFVSHEGVTLKSAILFLLPVATVGITAYYMMRLWLMAFAGKPRDHHVADHAHESPAVMTLPLIVLAVFSVAVGWGWPLWDAESAYLGQLLHRAQPKAVEQFAEVHHAAGRAHLLAGGVAFLLAVIGAGLAYARHRSGALVQMAAPSSLSRFFQQRWYFDRLYDALFTRPTMTAAKLTAAADKAPPGTAKTYDLTTLDGLLTSMAGSTVIVGGGLNEMNRGRPRSYVFVLALTATAVLGMLSLFLRPR